MKLNDNQELLRASLFTKANQHKKTHGCGGVPYAHGALLSTLVAAVKAKDILEVGTGVGFSTVCLSQGTVTSHIHTIEKDVTHVTEAQEIFLQTGINDRVTVSLCIAEDILPTLRHSSYDLIFYDGFIPQKKFEPLFFTLLKDNGLLITANLYLGDATGGRYLKLLSDERRWKTGLFSDTALSVKQ